jgi:hypothetical protein
VIDCPEILFSRRSCTWKEILVRFYQGQGTLLFTASPEDCMMKKTHRQESHGRPEHRKMIDVRIDPTVNEGPGSLRTTEEKFHRQKDTVGHQEGNISTLRQLLKNQDAIGYWEVPG